MTAVAVLLVFAGAMWSTVVWRRRLALVAEAAHELRGPLTAAQLALEAGGRPAGVALELRRAAVALEDLDAARRGGRAEERRVLLDVGALLGEAVDGWRPLAVAMATELHFQPPAVRVLALADPVRLLQACGNLVGNALEHGAGPVRVRLHLTAARVRVEVRDHGPGLRAPVAELAAGPHTGRRGHGLAVAARMAERHGGRLLTAPVAAGACVVLELPRADAVPRAAPPRRRRVRRRLLLPR
jgi:signal transduction histidine kinase